MKILSVLKLAARVSHRMRTICNGNCVKIMVDQLKAMTGRDENLSLVAKSNRESRLITVIRFVDLSSFSSVSYTRYSCMKSMVISATLLVRNNYNVDKL